MELFINIMKFISQDDICNAIAIICSILSMYITLKVNASLKKSTERDFYNKHQSQFREHFESFREYLIADNEITRELQSSIYKELIAIESQCSSVFTLKDKYVIFRLKMEVKGTLRSCSRRYLIQYISYWIGRFHKSLPEQ